MDIRRFKKSGTSDINFQLIYVSDNNAIIQFYYKFLYFYKRRFIVKILNSLYIHIFEIIVKIKLIFLQNPSSFLSRHKLKLITDNNN